MTDIPTLTKLTQAALSAAQDLTDPWKITARTDALPAMPRVGDQVTVRAPATWGYPAGIDTTARVGEVSYAVDGVECRTVTILAA